MVWQQILFDSLKGDRETQNLSLIDLSQPIGQNKDWPVE